MGKKQLNLLFTRLKSYKILKKKPDVFDLLSSSGLTNLFHQNVHSTPDYTYKVLQKLASDPNLVVLSGDKDSSVVIMQREVYVEKLEDMIKEGISNGKYTETEDTTLQDLKSFQSFLVRNFKSSLPLDKIKPTSNQPAFLYGTAKTHKFDNHSEITNENLKLRPIVSTCGTFYYDTEL